MDWKRRSGFVVDVGSVRVQLGSGSGEWWSESYGCDWRSVIGYWKRLYGTGER